MNNKLNNNTGQLVENQQNSPLNNFQSTTPLTEEPKKKINAKKMWLIVSLPAAVLVGASFVVWALVFNKQASVADVQIPTAIENIRCPSGQIVTFFSTPHDNHNILYEPDGYTCGEIPKCSFGGIPHYDPYGGTADQMWQLVCPGDEWSPDPGVDYKPVIYLYPSETQNIFVRLNYDGNIFASYPNYDNGWRVTAYSDGRITANGEDYSYLFWEGKPNYRRDYDLATGFVVKGSETREFLQEKLAEIGLTPKEYNEFIVYWYPKMQDNEYNLIHFASYGEYEKHAELEIIPKPDNILRVFMVYKPLSGTKVIAPQSFTKFNRDGFTVVEWGGSELR